MTDILLASPGKISKYSKWLVRSATKKGIDTTNLSLSIHHYNVFAIAVQHRLDTMEKRKDFLFEFAQVQGFDP